MRSEGTPMDLAQPPKSAPRSPSQSQDDSTFEGLVSSISVLIFKINANVQRISKLVDQLGKSDESTVSTALQKSLDDLTETTLAMVKQGHDELRSLQRHQGALPRRKILVQKTTSDFQLSLVAFQRAQLAQRSGLRNQKTDAENTKSVPHDQHQHSSSSEAPGATIERPTNKIPTESLSRHESSPHEVSNKDREQEILDIERGILELTEIFHDLSSVVESQSEVIGSIESSVDDWSAAGIPTDFGRTKKPVHGAMSSTNPRPRPVETKEGGCIVQ